MKRTLVIGDIHGGLKALKQVFEKAVVNAADTLIFLGDYVDGWSESSQVIDYLIALRSTQQCVFLKGNHDIWCEEWLRSGLSDRTWFLNGGKSTMDSYAKVQHRLKPSHLRFFEEMKLFETDRNNRLFVHAGFTASAGPGDEYNPSSFCWDRSLWELAVQMDHQPAQQISGNRGRLSLFQEIFIGHTPTLNYQETTPMHRCNVWNIDTGAAFTGPLSILDIDTKEFWQSDIVRNLYPNEKGRNRD